MAAVENVLDLVERHLREHHGLAGGRVEADRVVVALDANNTVQLWASAVARESLVSVQVRSTRRTERTAWPTVLRTLNEWNRRNRLTSAWLSVDDWELSSHGVVVLEATLPVAAEQPPEAGTDFVDAVLYEARQFRQLVLAA